MLARELLAQEAIEKAVANYGQAFGHRGWFIAAFADFSYLDLPAVLHGGAKHGVYALLVKVDARCPVVCASKT